MNLVRYASSNKPVSGVVKGKFVGGSKERKKDKQMSASPQPKIILQPCTASFASQIEDLLRRRGVEADEVCASALPLLLQAYLQKCHESALLQEIINDLRRER